MKLDTFTEAYIGALLWSETDNADDSGGRPLDENYGAEDIAPEALAEIISDCQSFQAEESYQAALAAGLWTEEQAGHDFLLTRNRHGAGFWDRGYGGSPERVMGERLTKAAHVYGTMGAYIGDDGLIYVHG